MFTFVFGRDSVCINVTSATIAVGVDCTRLKYVLQVNSEVSQLAVLGCHASNHLVNVEAQETAEITELDGQTVVIIVCFIGQV